MSKRKQRWVFVEVLRAYERCSSTTAVSVRDVLHEIDLEKYADSFEEHEVGLEDLPHLTRQDLKDIGTSLPNSSVGTPIMHSLWMQHSAY